MGINPFAVIFWILTSGIGFLVGGTLTAVVAGLVIGITISLLMTLL